MTLHHFEQASGTEETNKGTLETNKWPFTILSKFRVQDSSVGLPAVREQDMFDTSPPPPPPPAPIPSLEP